MARERTASRFESRLDNVTHSLIGHALARVSRPRASHAREPSAVDSDAARAERRAAIWTGILASNAGDLDFIAGFLADDRKLAYLLHHRGHTHTLIFAVPIGLLLAAACARVFSVREASARLRLLALGVVAALLHIGFDALNDYGVHPFYPFDNRWYYGDAVFIIEPWLLAVLLPQLVHGALSRVGRVVGIVLALALLFLLFGPSGLPIAVAATSTLLLAVMLIVLRKSEHRAWLSLAGAAIVVVVFAASAAIARGKLSQTLARARPDERIVELATTPMPGNPLCHRALIVSTDAAQVYRVRIVQQSLLPGLFEHARCGFRAGVRRTAPLQAEAEPAPALLGVAATEGMFEAKLAELLALRSRYCDAEAALRFLRVPYWLSGPHATLGDLRYDHEPGLGFAELVPKDECTDRFPAWVPPLAELLNPP